MSEINILGLNMYHGATACLLRNGKVVGAVSEERFSRKKNQGGFPEKSIDYLLKSQYLSLNQIDAVVLGGSWPVGLVYGGRDIGNTYTRGSILDVAGWYLLHIPFLESIYRFLHKNLYQRIFFPRWRRGLLKFLYNKLNGCQIIFCDHHLAHTYATLYGFCDTEGLKKLLVLTKDAAGDGTCSSISLFEDGRLREVAPRTPNYESFAWFYAMVTRYLGMKVCEHEYKVMGLAPYADKSGVDKTYHLLKRIFYLDGDLRFHSKINCHSYYHYLKKYCEGHRFDWVAGAAQRLVEEYLSNWVSHAIRKFGINQVAVGGGIFLNVKANMVISQLPEVERMYVCPTASDESNAIGAAYYGYEKICREKGIPFDPQGVKDLYLGPEYSDEEILNEYKLYSFRNRTDIERVGNMEREIAQLLARNFIVARFHGRMEWGARALGNRSILANPSDYRVVKKINEQIKNRDFWMPFAGTILSEREKDYLINPKSIPAPYMAISFNTTNRAQEDLVAALHPYDYTTRPQVLKAGDNPSFYKIVKEFEKLTGIGGVLNTSFNLHGDPIVCSPRDAFYTFDNSGLKYLAIGSFLIRKSIG